MSENENREIKKTSAAENLMQLMSFTAEQAKELANANSVLGEKMEFGDVTVIPVSKISAGFAGGGASFINATQKKSQTPSGSGAKVTVTPMTFLVIEGGKVNVLDINAKSGTDVKTEISAFIEKIKALKGKKK